MTQQRSKRGHGKAPKGFVPKKNRVTRATWKKLRDEKAQRNTSTEARPPVPATSKPDSPSSVQSQKPKPAISKSDTPSSARTQKPRPATGKAPSKRPTMRKDSSAGKRTNAPRGSANIDGRTRQNPNFLSPDGLAEKLAHWTEDPRAHLGSIKNAAKLFKKAAVFEKNPKVRSAFNSACDRISRELEASPALRRNLQAHWKLGLTLGYLERKSDAIPHVKKAIQLAEGKRDRHTASKAQTFLSQCLLQ